MKCNFLIIDDDINIRKILKFIIKENDLGNVIGELDSGEDAVNKIDSLSPDIVLIDLLLPIEDGISVIKKAKKNNFNGKFIMISQVEDKNLISKSYESGVIFFIGKPINNIEVISVINSVKQSIELEKSITIIKSTLLNNENKQQKMQEKFHKNQSLHIEISKFFSDLGINSELGSKELFSLIINIMNRKSKDKSFSYKLQEMYQCIQKDLNSNLNIKSLEQRIRRIISKALNNIAERALDDYYDPIFCEYSSLFDFKQIRKEMLYIQSKSKDKGKVNIKKFAEGIIDKLQFLEN